MNIKKLGVLGAIIAGVAISGCALESADPLLFDEEGNLRAEVDATEVENAGVTDRCTDISIESFGEPVRVPIAGEEGTFLVGVGGWALCLDDQGGVGGDLDDLDVGDDTDLEDDEVSDLRLQNGDSEDSEGGSTNTAYRGLRQYTGNNPGNRPIPTVKSDPTPEPSGE